MVLTSNGQTTSGYNSMERHAAGNIGVLGCWQIISFMFGKQSVMPKVADLRRKGGRAGIHALPLDVLGENSSRCCCSKIQDDIRAILSDRNRPERHGAKSQCINDRVAVE